jgi:hypothetical protein
VIALRRSRQQAADRSRAVADEVAAVMAPVPSTASRDVAPSIRCLFSARRRYRGWRQRARHGRAAGRGRLLDAPLPPRSWPRRRAAADDPRDRSTRSATCRQSAGGYASWWPGRAPRTAEGGRCKQRNRELRREQHVEPRWIEQIAVGHWRRAAKLEVQPPLRCCNCAGAHRGEGQEGLGSRRRPRRSAPPWSPVAESRRRVWRW